MAHMSHSSIMMYDASRIYHFKMPKQHWKTHLSTKITIGMTERNFRHMKLLHEWIQRNKKSARDRLAKHEHPSLEVDSLELAKTKKLAAAAEAALVQWDIYSDLIAKILYQKPTSAETFDGQKEDGQEEDGGEEASGPSAQPGDGEVQQDGVDGPQGMDGGDEGHGQRGQG